MRTKYALPADLDRDLAEVFARADGRRIRAAPSGCYAGAKSLVADEILCETAGDLRRAVRKIWAAALLDEPEDHTGGTFECDRGCSAPRPRRASGGDQEK